MHNVLLGQYDSPVACSILAVAVKTLSHGKTILLRLFFLCSFRKKLENLFRFSFPGTRNITFETLKIGQNDPEIPNLEFENHGFLENQVFLPTEQAETYLEIYVLIHHST